MDLRRLFIPTIAMTIALGIGIPPKARSTPATTRAPVRVLQTEEQRVAVIAKVQSTIVSILAPGGRSGASGVLIDPEGYALTCFHVVAPFGPIIKCGLPDGLLYDAVLVGVDRVGDVALIKLAPQKTGDKFPFAKMGDSDQVRTGDWTLALGNPFLLATYFTPTATFGLVSGVHRYRPPNALGQEEYTDCLQIDASVNPGNSGGPLFNMAGELIGVSGRISTNTRRGQLNVGAGYAISINQIKNFLSLLRAGLEVDHASLGALIGLEAEDVPAPRTVVQTMLEDCDISRRGVVVNDELLEFAGRSIHSANQFKNILGVYPRGWRVPLAFRRDGVRNETLVRLMGVAPRQVDDQGRPLPPRSSQPNAPLDRRSPAAQWYQAKPGFANYYFNRRQQERLLAGFRKHGDFTGRTGAWVLEAAGRVRNKNAPVKFTIREEKSADGKEIKTVVRYALGGVDVYEMEPLKPSQAIENLKDPPGSGGLLTALYLYRQLLTLGEKGFVGEFYYGGLEPFYRPTPRGRQPDFVKQRIDAEVLATRHGGMVAKWYFSPKDQTMLGFEVSVAEREDDPCEVYFSDYRPVEGRLLPHHLQVRHGGKARPGANQDEAIYADLQIQSFQTKTDQ